MNGVPPTRFDWGVIDGACMYFHLELRGQNAGELALLLGKHPDRLFEWEANGSMVRVFFPIYLEERTRVVVLYWPDPLGVTSRVSRQVKQEEFVGTRAYAINSLFCSALKVAFNATITGQRKASSEVLDREHDLQVTLCPVCTYLAPDRIVSLFSPLGYRATIRELPGVGVEFSIRHPRVFELTLEGRVRVADVLRHVLIMTLVMDSDRHEYMGQNDVERLRRLGSDWLEAHPERTFIISRYLVYRRLIDAFIQAPRRGEEVFSDPEQVDDGYDAAGEPLPVRMTPEIQRNDQILAFLRGLPGRHPRLLHFGCGDGKLTSELVQGGLFDEVVGVDSSPALIERARRRIERSIRYANVLNCRPTRYELLVSALGYQDGRLEGFDIAILAGVLEHVEEGRLAELVAPVVESWHPGLAVVVVPNRRWSFGSGEREGRKNEHVTDLDIVQLTDLCNKLARGTEYSVEVRRLGAVTLENESPYLMALLCRDGGLQ